MTNESVDLLAVLKDMTRQQHSCQIELDYDVSVSPPPAATLAFITQLAIFYFRF